MSNTAHIGMIRQAVEAAGATLPKPVVDALAARDAITATASQLPTGSHADAMAAVADALVAGRDPLDDKQVRRLVVARILAGESGNNLSYGVGQAADERIAATIAEHVDAIIDSFKNAVDAAGQVLADAHDLFGDVDLGDSHIILKMGPKASGLWASAREAEKCIRVVDGGWFAFANLGVVSASTSSTLRLSDPGLEQFELVGHRATPWTIVRAGVVIDMATRVTIAEREQRLAAERGQREQRATSAFSNEYRRTHGSGPRVAAG